MNNRIPLDIQLQEYENRRRERIKTIARTAALLLQQVLSYEQDTGNEITSTATVVGITALSVRDRQGEGYE